MTSYEKTYRCLCFCQGYLISAIWPNGEFSQCVVLSQRIVRLQQFQSLPRNFRSTCKRFATILFRGRSTGVIFQTAGFTYRNCIVKEIISDFNFMLNKLDPRDSGVKGGPDEALVPPFWDDSESITDNRQWPSGRINKSILVDYLANRPLDLLERYCNISKGIVKQETLQSHSFSSDSLVHNGSVLHYFYNPNGIVDPTERFKFLFEITLQVHKKNCNLLHWAPDVHHFNYVMDCVTPSWSRRNFGLPKLVDFIQKRNQNGDTILHEWAKKGDFFLSILNCL